MSSSQATSSSADMPEKQAAAAQPAGEGQAVLPGFFSPFVANERKAALKLIAKSEVLLIAIILGILSIYWGALHSVLPNIPALTIGLIDLDDGEIGQSMTTWFRGAREGDAWVATKVEEGSLEGLVPLGYTLPGTCGWDHSYSSYEEVVKSVRHEDMWVAIVAMPGASANMNAVYDGTLAPEDYLPSGAIRVVYQEARNAIAVDELLIPFLIPTLRAFTESFAQNKTASLAQSLTTTTDLVRALQLPIPASYALENLNPYLPVQGSAATEIGLIYLIILAFFSVLFFGQMHMTFAGKLRPVSYWVYRMTIPIVSYFFLSLFYAVLSRAWEIHLETHGGRGGFVVYWMLAWVGMTALGVAIENINNFFGPPWTPTFLIFWVISNVSTGFLPIELLSNFYRWGIAWPFFHIVKASNHLIFGTKDELGLNFGVLIAWAVLNYAILPVSIGVELRRFGMRVDANKKEMMVRLGQPVPEKQEQA
ncbi:hypothetical protein G7K_1445-t1 [Saitoella complicata NRRL Y-17804]|uniref:DUF3533 domain-containing protein n=1 Tax=Saitoella complicata (strain BCRC 22490 / CBS 7301 / JCM 7358 / NBRC 10748 / NRRL Y-17804) TaxID=698492 RepID=A0A0E9NCU2_SAICN|nr:hypothetical protein G7K_1445-t1 [Saitoella complicata NRRL Y-17804]